MISSIPTGFRNCALMFLLAASIIATQASVAPSLSVSSVRGFTDQDSELALNLLRATNTTAFQFDLSFNPLTADRMPPVWSELLSNHVVRTHELKPGLWRTLIYSPSNALLRPKLTVATLPFHIPATERNGSGAVTPSNFILSHPDATAVQPVSTRPGGIFISRISPPNLDGSVSLFFPVTKAGDYVLYASDDFTRWSAVDTNSASGSIVDFIDYDAPRYPHRFYFMSEQAPASSPAPLSSPQLSEIGGISTMSIPAPGQGVYRVEASADLKTWTPIGEATSKAGLLQIPISNVTEARQRFFRVLPK